MIAKKAFSLVEMLVAVVLITLIIGVAIFSFKYQLMAIAKTKQVGINRVISYNQLRSSLESIKFYVVDDYDILNRPMKNLHYYFNGSQESIDFITQNPLFSNEIALVKLQCIENSLLYKEEKLYANMDFLRPKISQNAREIKLYDNLEDCKFSYKEKSFLMKNIQNSIPQSIIVNISQEESSTQIYVNIQSDYNRSILRIHDAIYPNE